MASPARAPGPRRNLERKARCADLAAARGALQRLGAREEGGPGQTDTYFPAAAGRLKLRVIEGGPALLIQDGRGDEGQVQPSAYFLVPVADAGLLAAALTAA